MSFRGAKPDAMLATAIAVPCVPCRSDPRILGPSNNNLPRIAAILAEVRVLSYTQSVREHCYQE